MVGMATSSMPVSCASLAGTAEASPLPSGAPSAPDPPARR